MTKEEVEILLKNLEAKDGWTYEQTAMAIVLRSWLSQNAELEALKHITGCAKTPLMQDVLKELEALKAVEEAARVLNSYTVVDSSGDGHAAAVSFMDALANLHAIRNGEK